MTRRTAPLYVHPLNSAQEGPYTLEQALISVKGHHYITQAEIDRMSADYEAGGAGPWHFSYGFTSTTITVGAVATGATTAPAKASTLEVMDAYETARGIAYELSNAVGHERALRQLKLLLDNTTQGARDSGMADAAFWKIACIVEFDTRKDVSTEASLEAIQETITSYDAEMRLVAKRAA